MKCVSAATSRLRIGQRLHQRFEPGKSRLQRFQPCESGAQLDVLALQRMKLRVVFGELGVLAASSAARIHNGYEERSVPYSAKLNELRHGIPIHAFDGLSQRTGTQ